MKKRKWTAEEEKFLKQEYPVASMTIKQIARHIGRSEDAVKARGAFLNLNRPHFARGGRPKGIVNQRKWVPVPKPKEKEVVAPDMPPHPVWTPDLDLEVMKTAGRWEHIYDIAVKIGKETQLVQQRFHRLLSEEKQNG